MWIASRHRSRANGKNYPDVLLSLADDNRNGRARPWFAPQWFVPGACLPVTGVLPSAMRHDASEVAASPDGYPGAAGGRAYGLLVSGAACAGAGLCRLDPCQPRP